MAFRSDLDAAHARAAALEDKVATLEAENAELRGEKQPEVDEPVAQLRQLRISAIVGIVFVVLFGAGASFAVYGGGFPGAATAVGILTLSLVVAIGSLLSLVQICPPGFVIVLAGRKNRAPDGSYRGYRVVTHGRVLRYPILEEAQLLDCRARTLDCQIVNAYSKDNLTLRVDARLLYKISSHQPVVGNAVDRFLGRDMHEVDRVATETAEGHLRAVVAVLTKAELETDKAKVAELLIEEIEPDFERLGLEIDTLALRHVAGPDES